MGKHVGQLIMILIEEALYFRRWRVRQSMAGIPWRRFLPNVEEGKRLQPSQARVLRARSPRAIAMIVVRANHMPIEISSTPEIRRSLVLIIKRFTAADGRNVQLSLLTPRCADLP